jgi:hypothetical protein
LIAIILFIQLEKTDVTGGLGVAGSNPVAPTNDFNGLGGNLELFRKAKFAFPCDLYDNIYLD